MEIPVPCLLKTDARQWAVIPILLILLQIMPMPPGGGKPGLLQPATSPSLSVKTDKTQYRLGEPVTVSIKNVSASSLTAYGGGYFCTVVRLEKKTGQGWIGVENCTRMSVPRPEILAPGPVVTVRFPQRSGPEATGIPRGTFRFMVIFEIPAQANRPGQAFIAHSNTFAVK